MDREKAPKRKLFFVIFLFACIYLKKNVETTQCDILHYYSISIRCIKIYCVNPVLCEITIDEAKIDGERQNKECI